MSLLVPSDPLTLATAVVDTLVVASDPRARHASIFYWERGRSHTLAVVEAAAQVEDATVRTLATQLQADSAAPAIYYQLRGRLARAATDGPSPATATLLDRGWQAECNSRLGFHLGPHYSPTGGAAQTAAALAARPPGEPLPAEIPAPVLVVIPFRDSQSTGGRLRNLLACLQGLRDQSVPRESYRVVVVESDTQPRRRQEITPFTDHYLFARKAGAFNKSWAVNSGVVNAPHPPELVCVLDADVLVDHRFVERNTARFRRPGRMGHLSYRDMWTLDEAATGWAIEQRLHQRAEQVDPDHLRAFVLRRPPGCCVWVRTSAYFRIGGMDERFEGWGGEDNDFAYRMDTNSAFDSYDDVLLHMYHQPSAVLRADGEIVNAHIPGLSWRPDAIIGDLARFADDPPPAGITTDSAQQGEVRT